MEGPSKINDKRLRFDAFSSGKDPVFPDKKQRLPVMGWNSWNAFGSGNNLGLMISDINMLCWMTDATVLNV